MAFSKSPPTDHDDVRICQGETSLTASGEALGEEKYRFSFLLLFRFNRLICIRSWSRWHLVEGEVAPVGTKLIPQELTRQGPVVDHCVPDGVNRDYDIGKHKMPNSWGDGFLYSHWFVVRTKAHPNHVI